MICLILNCVIYDWVSNIASIATLVKRFVVIENFNSEQLGLDVRETKSYL